MRRCTLFETLIHPSIYSTWVPWLLIPKWKIRADPTQRKRRSTSKIDRVYVVPSDDARQMQVPVT